MIAQLEIRKLSLPEKLDLLEAVWTELSAVPDALIVPQWHKDILDDRLLSMQQGSMNAIDWDQAKQQIRSQIT
jgi:putative addiction module component (TIGR02574 family)